MRADEAITRRDFLKLAALAPAVYLASAPGSPLPARQETGENIKTLILVLDALSARNMSLYGYPRQTTPQIDRFAERSYVYHNHHAAGNFTTPGTASLLTGAYPWSHRAFHMHGVVNQAFAKRNIFLCCPPNTYRVAFSHNLLVSSLFQQFCHQIELYLPARRLALADLEYSDIAFPCDYNVSFWSESLILRQSGTKQGSLFLSLPYSLFQHLVKGNLSQPHSKFKEIPNVNGVFFELSEAIDWLVENWSRLPGPALGYFHFLPPHEPYTPPVDFLGRFCDGYFPPAKPSHFAGEGLSQAFLDQQRQLYDEYLAYADAELGRLLVHLEQSGDLESTRVILTSDHGELFERGIRGHITPVLYEPVLHIPLVIHEPGQTSRIDVHTPSSCVDLLPTLCQLNQVATPAWSEGQVLPIYSGLPPDEMRILYAVEAKSNPVAKPLKRGTVALYRNGYKLIRYLQVNRSQLADELYHLGRDPEELNNLAYSQSDLALELGAILDEKLQQVNQPYVG